MDISSHTDKGRAVWWHENYRLLSDCLGICFYLGATLLPHGYLLPDDLAKAGDRYDELVASFVRLGLAPSADSIRHISHIAIPNAYPIYPIYPA